MKTARYFVCVSKPIVRTSCAGVIVWMLSWAKAGRTKPGACRIGDGTLRACGDENGEYAEDGGDGVDDRGAGAAVGETEAAFARLVLALTMLGSDGC